MTLKEVEAVNSVFNTTIDVLRKTVESVPEDSGVSTRSRRSAGEAATTADI